MQSQVASESPFIAQFQQYATEIDQINGKHDLLRKVSRDVTKESKNVISLLHRKTTQNKQPDLSKVKERLEAVRTHVAQKIASELDEQSQPLYRRDYSPAMQEYVEARELLSYLDTGNLAGIEKLQEEFNEECGKAGSGCNITLEPGDYVLGVADVTGELMRQAVAKAGKADEEGLGRILVFLQGILKGMVGLEGVKSAVGRDYEGKMKTLQENMRKVEKGLFDLKIRKAEAGGFGEAGLKRRRLND